MFQLGKIQILQTTPSSNFGRPISHVTKLIILCDAQQVGSHRCASGNLTDRQQTHEKQKKHLLLSMILVV